MIKNLKYIKIIDIFSIFILLLLIIPSIIFRIINKIKNKRILLITENGYTARDNGYHFYKYIRTNHKDELCYYVIDKKSNDYNKVKEYGNIIQFGSLKHWLYYLSAKYNISNQKYGNPNKTVFYFIHVILGLLNNRVFLQHGITKDDSPWLYYKNTKFRYFICGAKKEYEYIKEKFGYPKDNLIYTGFARFDNLHDLNVKPNQILIMPTWRNWLGRETNLLSQKIKFKETNYFKKWDELLNNKKFINFIEKNNINVLFYPHMNMQKYLNDFKSKSANIKIVSMDTDIQKVLKESSIMITDYSSVFMDFAYMEKPILFYQFDYDEYRKKQLAEGYYDYKNGFGPSVDNCTELVDKFINIYKNGLERKYKEEMKHFFEIKDNKNSERIYKYLK